MLVFLSPSNQIENVWIDGSNEEAEAVQIADTVERILRSRGVDVMRRDELRPFNAATGVSRTAAAIAAGVDLYIPIHSNASPKHNATGTCIFVQDETAPGTAAVSKRYAQALAAQIDGICGKRTRPLYADWALTEQRQVTAAGIPSVYLEYIFHDQPDEVSWYRAHESEMAAAIADAIQPARRIWTVQVGAWYNKSLAEEYLAQVRQHYPDAFLTSKEVI